MDEGWSFLLLFPRRSLSVALRKPFLFCLAPGLFPFGPVMYVLSPDDICACGHLGITVVLKSNRCPFQSFRHSSSFSLWRKLFLLLLSFSCGNEFHDEWRKTTTLFLVAASVVSYCYLPVTLCHQKRYSLDT